MPCLHVAGVMVLMGVHWEVSIQAIHHNVADDHHILCRSVDENIISSFTFFSFEEGIGLGTGRVVAVVG